MHSAPCGWVKPQRKGMETQGFPTTFPEKLDPQIVQRSRWKRKRMMTGKLVQPNFPRCVHVPFQKSPVFFSPSYCHYYWLTYTSPQHTLPKKIAGFHGRPCFRVKPNGFFGPWPGCSWPGLGLGRINWPSSLDFGFQFRGPPEGPTGYHGKNRAPKDWLW